MSKVVISRSVLDDVERACAEMLRDVGAPPAAIEDLKQYCAALTQPCQPEISELALIQTHTLLDHWFFDGTPLATRVLYYLGVLSGMFRPPPEKDGAWTSFAGYMEEFLARERATRMAAAIGGWLYPGEAEYFWECVKVTRSLDADVCEIGAWTGRSTTIWAAALRHAATRRVLHVVDNWEWGQDKDKYPFLLAGRDVFSEFQHNLSGLGEFYTVHRGLAAKQANAVRLAASGRLAILFHDAGHTTDDVVGDLRSYVPMVVPGGLVVVHDYHHPLFPDVRPAVDAVLTTKDFEQLSAPSTLGVFRRRNNDAPDPARIMRSFIDAGKNLGAPIT